jgi:uncharacterized protein (DUF58 family)
MNGLGIAIRRAGLFVACCAAIVAMIESIGWIWASAIGAAVVILALLIAAANSMFDPTDDFGIERKPWRD